MQLQQRKNNALNLPKKITVTGNNGGTIQFYYTATDQKVQKTVQSNAGTTTTLYDHGFIYKNGQLQFFSQPEGYIKANDNGGFTYVFQYKDQLGNIRLSYKNTHNGTILNPDVAIVEEHNYYPFGLQHHGYHETVNGQPYPYKTYQGQELVKALGLNWLTFKYRSYDPAIGRFLQVDPLAGKYPYNSVYAFQENKLGMGVELEGLELIYFTKTAIKAYTYSSQKITQGVQWIQKNMVFNVYATGSIGTQAGVHTEFFDLGAGIVTGKLGKVGWSFQNEHNYGFYALESKGIGHNFIEADIKLFSKKVSLGGKVDYVTNKVIPPEGSDLAKWYPENGEAHWNFSVGPGKSYGRGKMGDYNFITTGQPSLKAESDCSCFDFSLGARLILGGKIGIKLGIKDNNDKIDIEK